MVRADWVRDALHRRSDLREREERAIISALQSIPRNRPDFDLAMLDNSAAALEHVGRCAVATQSLDAAKARDRRQIIADRARILAAEQMEPADYQEVHSPTEATTVRVRIEGSKRVSREVARRRKPDARLWSAMRPEQEAAAENIAAAWYLITGEVGCKVARFEPGGGGRRESTTERATRLVAAYMAWARDLDERGYPHRVAAMSVLLGNETMRHAERIRNRRNGWARENLMEALDRYATLFPRLVGRSETTSCAAGTK